MNAALFLHDHTIHFYHLHGLDWVDIVSALDADIEKASQLAFKYTDNPISTGTRITSYNVCYTKLLRYNPITVSIPLNPKRSPRYAKMKSVDETGRKSSCVWVASSLAFPSIPPEPIAISAWRT